MPATPTDKTLIVGCGCFGLSTAYHLLKRGYKDVTVIDRSPILPAPDAASQDLNKVVRTSYDDEFYSRLAREAIESWKDEREWGDTYHQSGVLVLDSSSEWGETAYTNGAYYNDIALGARVQLLGHAATIRQVFPAQANVALFPNVTGYLNRDGGWAHASQGVSIMMDKVIALGGRVLAGKAVEALLQHNGKTSGVRCADGSVFHGQVVILATGSWTASSFPDLRLQCVATGQSIATIQLTPEETDSYQDCPVVLDFGSGFYVFPPNKDGIMKMAIHAAGYTHMPTTGPPVSTPRTVTSHAQDGLLIPRSAAKALRHHLREVYPDLAEKPFSGTRLCWYTDSPDGDWIISCHPSDSALVLATAGSGHAYKFLPVIGRLVADVVQGTLDPPLREKFAMDRECGHMDLSRFRNEVVSELDLEQLCSSQDLLPHTQ